MDDEADHLSPANINYFAWEVAQGTATPDAAKRLLREFVRQAPAIAAYVSHARAGDQRGWQHLIEHLAACFGAYVAGRKELEPSGDASNRSERRAIKVNTLDKAFGLVRATSGPQPVDSDTLAEVAAQVLRELVRGESLERAAFNVGDERKKAGLQVTSDSHIRDVWANNKMGGWTTLRLMRLWGLEPGGDWTDAERKRLEEIYWDVPGFLRPGETPFDGRNAIPDLSSAHGGKSPNKD